MNHADDYAEIEPIIDNDGGLDYQLEDWTFDEAELEAEKQQKEQECTYQT